MRGDFLDCVTAHTGISRLMRCQPGDSPPAIVRSFLRTCNSLMEPALAPTARLRDLRQREDLAYRSDDRLCHTKVDPDDRLTATIGRRGDLPLILQAGNPPRTFAAHRYGLDCRTTRQRARHDACHYARLRQLDAARTQI